MPRFRSTTPARRSLASGRPYRLCKMDLRADFGRRCGYCDGRDQYCGGGEGFHIDHFAPKSRFPHLRDDYNNLVYSCPYCNRSKSNFWASDDPLIPIVGDRGFIDPCKAEYDTHFSRNLNGEIVYETVLGRFIYEKLHLYLRRHAIIYLLDQLEIVIDQLADEFKAAGSSEEAIELARLITEAWREYKRSLGELFH